MAKHSLEFIPAPRIEDLKQKQLAKVCYWEPYDQLLWVDAREVFPELGVLKIPAWEKMIMDSDAIPEYPAFLKPLEWPKQRGFVEWLKQVPVWVADSCRLFPDHQLKLLHYVGKYPQLLELLDHAPYLAWRLIASGLQEPEIVALLSGKRQKLIQQLGWPGHKETLKFLQKLRLRSVNPMIVEQLDICVYDPERLHALKSLPRINSMALTLAARFPELIGSRLHLALAQLPCKPMQCQGMIALLEDAYRFAEVSRLPKEQTDRIGQSRYLQEVHCLYLNWIKSALLAQQATVQPDPLVWQTFQQLIKPDDMGALADWSRSAKELAGEWQNTTGISVEPKVMSRQEDILTLSLLQEHAWWPDLEQEKVLYVWRQEDSGEQSAAGIWAALVNLQAIQPGVPAKIEKVRSMQNQLPTAKQLSHLHLFLAREPAFQF